MKKLVCALLSLVLLLSGFALGEETPLDFARLTGLDKARELLDSGEVIERIYYTDGYGFSISEFSTTDGAEIDALWKAVNAIQIVGKTNEGITDWYPQIIFFFSNDTHLNICFEAHWLEIGMDNYTVGNDEAFWSLTAALTAAYAAGGGEEEPEERYYYYSPIALTVNGIVITPQELEEAMRSSLLQAALSVRANGHAYDMADRDNIIDTLDKVLFDLEIRTVIREQAEIMGLDDLTAEEYESLWNTAQEEWEQLCGRLSGSGVLNDLPKSVYRADPDDPEGNIIRCLASFGLTEDTLYAEQYDWLLEQKLMDAVAQDADPDDTDERIGVYTDWLLEQFDEADIYESGVGIAEVCFRLIP